MQSSDADVSSDQSWLSLPEAKAEYQKALKATEAQFKIDVRRHIASGLILCRLAGGQVVKPLATRREIAELDFDVAGNGEVWVAEGKFRSLLLSSGHVERLCRSRRRNAFETYLIPEDTEEGWLSVNRAIDFIELKTGAPSEAAQDALSEEIKAGRLRIAHGDGSLWGAEELAYFLSEAYLDRQSRGGFVERGEYEFYPARIHSQDFQDIWKVAARNNRPATNEEIRNACIAVYEKAKFNNAVPPNLANAPREVMKQLAPLTAKRLTILPILKEKEIAKFRRRAGNQPGE